MCRWLIPGFICYRIRFHSFCFGRNFFEDSFYTRPKNLLSPYQIRRIFHICRVGTRGVMSYSDWIIEISSTEHFNFPIIIEFMIHQNPKIFFNTIISKRCNRIPRVLMVEKRYGKGKKYFQNANIHSNFPYTFQIYLSICTLIKHWCTVIETKIKYFIQCKQGNVTHTHDSSFHLQWFYLFFILNKAS